MTENNQYWIFAVTEHRREGEIYSPEQIYQQRMEDKFWGIGRRTPNRKNLSKGDKVIYYVGLPHKVFAGTASLASSCFELDESTRKKLSHGTFTFSTEFGVHLDDVDIWKTPKSVESLVPQLGFIENKAYWFSYFQGGVRQISEEDYRIILGEREASLSEKIATTKDIESESEFALETHLEEFIYQNWGKIDWGSKLEIYKSEDQNGRQFPAGTWSIDFLAVDKSTNDLVVIELKRGKTSDSTVGQILRYMNWIKGNIAEDNQNVRGIIIAKGIDEALKYASVGLSNVELKTYKVDFQLASFIT